MLTILAFEHMTQVAVSALGRSDPRAVYPWRHVPDMLIVSTFEFGNPVLLFVLVESDDTLLHAAYSIVTPFRRASIRGCGVAVSGRCNAFHVRP